MDKEKIIREIAQVMCVDDNANCTECQAKGLCDFYVGARLLYSAGYRKADDLIAENERLEKRLDDKCDRCIERERKSVAIDIFQKVIYILEINTNKLSKTLDYKKLMEQIESEKQKYCQEGNYGK